MEIWELTPTRPSRHTDPRLARVKPLLFFSLTYRRGTIGARRAQSVGWPRCDVKLIPADMEDTLEASEASDTDMLDMDILDMDMLDMDILDMDMLDMDMLDTVLWDTLMESKYQQQLAISKCHL